MNPTRTCASIPHIHVHCCSAPECLALFRLTPQPPLRLSRFLLCVVRERRGGRGSKEAGGGARPSPARGPLRSLACRPRASFAPGCCVKGRVGVARGLGCADAPRRQIHTVPGDLEDARCGPAARVANCARDGARRQLRPFDSAWTRRGGVSQSRPEGMEDIGPRCARGAVARFRARHGSPQSFSLKSGKRITSRIVDWPVRIIVSRSTPMPNPPQGGMP